MFKRVIILVVIMMVLFFHSASANGLLHVTGAIGGEGDYSAYDAVFLASGELLVVGSRRDAWDQDTTTRPWAAIIDANTSDVMWTFTAEDIGDAYAFNSAVAYQDGFAVCVRRAGSSYLMFMDGQRHSGKPIELEAYIHCICPVGENLLVAGYTDSGAPWAGLVDGEGEAVWQYAGAPTGEELSSFSCAVSTADGILLGGSTPEGGLLLKLDFNGNMVWTRKGTDLGLTRNIQDICIDADRIVLAGNMYDASRSVTAGVATSLSTQGELICERVLDLSDLEGKDNGFQGVYLQKSGQGYTYYGWLANDMMNADIPVEKYTLLYLVDRDMNYRNEYHPPYGTDATVVKILRDAHDTVWVIGQGNGQDEVLRYDYSENHDKQIFIAYINFILLDAS